MTESAPSNAAGRTRQRWFLFVIHEPFFQFLLLGLVIWAGVEYWSDYAGRYLLHVGPAEQQRLVATYSQEFGKQPTPAELKEMIDDYVREEIFFREAQALGLDKDDEIIRRRMVQKYTLLKGGTAAPEAPTPEALEQWYQQNKARYVAPEQVAFSQAFFSAEKDSDAGAKARALKALGQVRDAKTASAPNLGDTFPAPADINALGPEEAVRLFGRSELAEQLFKLPVGQWSGPFRSDYGWHIIYVSAHRPAGAPPLDAIHDRVLSDYSDEQQRLLDEKAYDQLRAKYHVTIEGIAR